MCCVKRIARSLQGLVARPYHHGDLRRAALEAALDLVDREGPDAVTMRRVARGADVSHTAVGKEFGGVAPLLGATASMVFLELEQHQRGAAEAARAVSPEQPHFAAFRALGAAYLAYGIAHPQRVQLLGHPLVGVALADDEELAAECSGPQTLLVETAAASVEEGGLRAMRPSRIAALVWSAVHGFVTLAAMGFFPEGAIDDLLADLYLGLAPSPSHEEGPPGLAGRQ